MLDFEKEIFQNCTPNEKKLLSFGFWESNSAYYFTAPIKAGEFILEVTIRGRDVNTRLLEKATGEEYVIYKIQHSVGDFAGNLRLEASIILKKIKDKCFDEPSFRNPMTKELIRLAQEQYDERLEFLWESSPTNAVIRRKDNHKWYAIFMVLQLSKLGLEEKRSEEVLVIRGETKEINGKTIFPGFHMNKKSWVSVVLDGRMELPPVEEMLFLSRELAKTN